MHVLVGLEVLQELILDIALDRYALSVDLVLGNVAAAAELLAKLGGEAFQVLGVVLEPCHLADDLPAASLELVDVDDSLVGRAFAKLDFLLWFGLSNLGISIFLLFLSTLALLCCLVSSLSLWLSVYLSGQRWMIALQPLLASSDVLLSKAAVLWRQSTP